MKLKEFAAVWPSSPRWVLGEPIVTSSQRVLSEITKGPMTIKKWPAYIISFFLGYHKPSATLEKREPPQSGPRYSVAP